MQLALLMLLGAEATAYEVFEEAHCGVPLVIADPTITTCRWEYLEGAAALGAGLRPVPFSRRAWVERGIEAWSTARNVGGGYDISTTGTPVDIPAAQAIRAGGDCLITFAGGPVSDPEHAAESRLRVQTPGLGCQWRGGDIILRLNTLAGHPTDLAYGPNFSVAGAVVHEVGHALGFLHNEAHPSVMNELQHTFNTPDGEYSIYGDEFGFLVREFPDGDVGENIVVVPVARNVEVTHHSSPKSTARNHETWTEPVARAYGEAWSEKTWTYLDPSPSGLYVYRQSAVVDPAHPAERIPAEAREINGHFCAVEASYAGSYACRPPAPIAFDLHDVWRPYPTVFELAGDGVPVFVEPHGPVCARRAGNYRVVFEADAYDDIDESSVADNVWTSDHTLSIVVDPKNPDGCLAFPPYCGVCGPPVGPL